MKRKSLDELFWSKVNKNGPKQPHMKTQCWVWTAGTFSGGYGACFVFSKTEQANRVSWKLHFGPIPDDQQVLHHCDNPPCVRPEHLWLGTTQQNTADRYKKGRSASGLRNGMNTHPEKRSVGAKHWTHTHPLRFKKGVHLTDEKVRQIKKLLQCATLKQVDIAAQFDISPMTISDIKHNRIWKHI